LASADHLQRWKRGFFSTKEGIHQVLWVDRRRRMVRWSVVGLTWRRFDLGGRDGSLSGILQKVGNNFAAGAGEEMAIWGRRSTPDEMRLWDESVQISPQKR
jgi:hypothetical protein